MTDGESLPQPWLPGAAISEAPANRVLSVRFVAEDGHVTSLAVGKTVEWHLQLFNDVSGTPATTTLHARAMPPRAARATPAERYEDGELGWPTTLRGDGWSAYWVAPRPTIGSIEVTGELRNDASAGIYGHDYEPSTRGKHPDGTTTDLDISTILDAIGQ